MSSFFNPGNKNYIEVGEKFIIKIVGWNCTTQEPDPPAKLQENNQQSSVNIPRDITLKKGKNKKAKSPLLKKHI